MTTLEGDTKQHETLFSGSVRPLQQSDIAHLRPILETWIRDRESHEIVIDEVEETLTAMSDSVAGENGREYMVDETDNGEIAGIMGMKTPDERMLTYTTTDRPVEFINAFISNEHRRKGIGRMLVKALEQRAREKGHTEIILNSGPRYMHSGWAAWNKIFGKPIAIAKNYYGEDGNAPVWEKVL